MMVSRPLLMGFFTIAAIWSDFFQADFQMSYGLGGVFGVEEKSSHGWTRVLVPHCDPEKWTVRSQMLWRVSEYHHGDDQNLCQSQGDL
ncbi:uncharacterized protein CTRU02_206023 [Colletotrichum truncatum]|uniref:Uncharacterized protein n=1 Tax=Colletotrichum truncatum TaxID=5467 RepID=A0ACC3Z5N8_COLTU